MHQKRLAVIFIKLFKWAMKSYIRVRSKLFSYQILMMVIMGPETDNLRTRATLRAAMTADLRFFKSLILHKSGK